ncbi:MAG: hypothetical protein J5845_03115 [Lachnospiraceae bacterium]|nr:hypothetical protein [Lachnospiraceae bacterium]
MIQKLKAVFSRNIGMKLLSFALAFLIWVVIMSLSDPVTTKQIDGITLETRHKDDFNNLEENENLSIDILTKGTVSIKVSGSRSELEGLSASDFVAYADFNDFVGVNAIPINVETRSENTRKKVSIDWQSLTVMQVKLVKSKEKLINVIVEPINVPDDKYALTKSVSSNLLQVTGPEEVVEKISKLGGYVDISKLGINTWQQVTLKPYDKDGNEMDVASLELAQTSVLVEVEMLPTKDVEVIIDDKDADVVNGFGIYKIELAPQIVRVAASEGLLRTTNTIHIPLVPEEPLLKQIKPYTKDYDIKKYLAEGVYLKSENNIVSVSVTVEPIVEKEITFGLSELNVLNMPEGFVLHQGEEDGTTTITMTISGLKPDIDSITSASDLRPSVDLKGVTKAGKQEFPIKLNIADRNLGEITTDGIAELTIAEQ